MRNNNWQYLSIILFFFFEAGCSQKKAPLSSESILRYSSYELESIPFQYEGRCRARVVSRQINNSGVCSFIVRDTEFLFRISHPLRGQILHLLSNEHWIEVKDFMEGENRRLPNISVNRKKIIGFDLNLKELQSLFWGRKLSGNHQLNFFYSKKNRPERILRQNIKGDLSIEYQNWYLVQGVLLPKTISVTETESNNRLKIIVLEGTVSPPSSVPLSL